MTGIRSVDRVRAAAYATLVPLLLVGCADGGGDPGPEPTATGSASEATDSPTQQDPDATESPSVEPATGLELKQRSFTINVPKGWEKADGGAFSHRATSEKLISTITVVQIPGLVDTVDEAFRKAVDFYGAKRVERLPDTTLQGVPVYHFTFTDGQFREQVFGGTINQGDAFQVQLRFAKMRVSAKEAQDIVDAVLASFELR